MAPRTCQAPAGDVPADKPLTARLCGRPVATSATVEGVTFALCAGCAREVTMIDLTDFARPGESCAAALARAVSEGRRLCSYTSPTEEAREGLTAAEAEEVAAEDPGLVRVETDQARDERLARERAACDELTREGQALGEYDDPQPSPEALRHARRAELISHLRRLDRGDGCLGVAIDAALRSDPTATAEEIADGLREAEEDARIERERDQAQ